MRFSLLTHARHNLVAYLALFVALGGSSYAAIALPAKSVGAKQLRAGAVKSSAVKDRSLLARDFSAGQLPAGAQGVPGLNGADGLDGADGSDGTDGLDGVDGTNGTNGGTSVTMRFGSSGGSQTGQANCLLGERATGGGFGHHSTSPLVFVRSAPEPGPDGSTPTSWSVTASSTSFAGQTFSIYVICAAP